MKDWQIIVLGILVMIAILYFVGWDTHKDQQQSLKDYSECKAHTQDLEWCFKKFRPILKN